jgi:hypothetical protein
VTKKSVYIETTVPSVATSRPSRDALTAGRQAATLLFWENERYKYDLYISQFVVNECSLGDKEAALRRLEFIKDIPLLPLSEDIISLAYKYHSLLNISDRAITDCFHLATCVIAGIDYLLSWNCAHLGIHTYAKILKFNDVNNLRTPLLATPEALIYI